MSIADDIERLVSLFERGILSREEFDVAKGIALTGSAALNPVEKPLEPAAVDPRPVSMEYSVDSEEINTARVSDYVARSRELRKSGKLLDAEILIIRAVHAFLEQSCAKKKMPGSGLYDELARIYKAQGNVNQETAARFLYIEHLRIYCGGVLSSDLTPWTRRDWESVKQNLSYGQWLCGNCGWCPSESWEACDRCGYVRGKITKSEMSLAKSMVSSILSAMPKTK